MKVVMVTGSYPPEPCGVGDYTYCLVGALRELGVQVEVFHPGSWNIANCRGIVQQINQVCPDLIHIQYPTSGYGYKLTPQLLSLMLPVVSTIHEISQAHVLRQLSLLPFLLNSTATIFTSAYERDYAMRFFPWRLNSWTVIPIGSNVTQAATTAKDINDIVCFGLIRPNKGLEQVIDLARMVAARNRHFTIRIIGAVDEKHRNYFEILNNTSRDLPVKWNINMPNNEVASILARSNIGYLPFTDGASERRGSLLAMLTNGVAVITRKGPQTSKAIEEATLIADSTEQALLMVDKLHSEPATLKMYSERARAYVQTFSWPAIANRHVELYERILKTRRLRKTGGHI